MQVRHSLLLVLSCNSDAYMQIIGGSLLGEPLFLYLCAHFILDCNEKVILSPDNVAYAVGICAVLQSCAVQRASTKDIG